MKPSLAMKPSSPAHMRIGYIVYNELLKSELLFLKLPSVTVFTITTARVKFGIYSAPRI